MDEELINKLRYCGNAVSCIHCPYWEGCAGSKEYLTEAADAIEELKILADNGEATYEIMVRQTSYIEELKQKTPHWIPVKERLPNPKDLVLVCNEFGGVHYGYFESNKKWYTANNWLVDAWTVMSNVTHWMALPEPPKENE